MSKEYWLQQLSTITDPQDTPIPCTPMDIWLNGEDLVKSFSYNFATKSVVDIGCGIGRVGWYVIDRVASYVGYDVNERYLKFCRRTFSSYKNARFVHLDIRNSMYNPKGKLKASGLRLNESNNSQDLVLCISLFTHLCSLFDAQVYINEIFRVLKPGGEARVSFFRSPPNELCINSDRTVYREADIINLLRPFEILSSLRGMSQDRDDQWSLSIRKLSS